MPTRAHWFSSIPLISLLFPSHSATQLNKEWKVVHEKTEPLLESLKKYHQLPPDATLAKIKIDDARREVARLNQQISDTLARMNISYH